ncbi:hypothetical protein BO86DRAFT_394025 [Aspergillus japonicus CBS 114.51]|uniref:Myb-like domain-containing protein n=1 Tax=Aspergillus japonicus CBS 114.51 TaxID=1448312 RepID=A0A8T8WIZ4_ASPJA|nr:hypothetical protein BO86DRAFT_394025 [Aspergillus japonicus CBS 114.51]RAH75731.1 hypothetical protein BO86DRAFT_394025 [Aspergillus japonicus CBS 114.51]
MAKSPQSAASRRRKRDSTTQSVDFLNTVMHKALPSKSNINSPDTPTRRTRRTTLAEIRPSREDLWEIPRSPELAPASEPRRRPSTKLTTVQTSWKSRLRGTSEDESGREVITPGSEGLHNGGAANSNSGGGGEGAYDYAEDDEDAEVLANVGDEEAYGSEDDTEMIDVQEEGSLEDDPPQLNLFSDNDQELTPAQHTSSSSSVADDDESQLQPVKRLAKPSSARSHLAEAMDDSGDEQENGPEASGSSQRRSTRPFSQAGSDNEEEVESSPDEASGDDDSDSTGQTSTAAEDRTERRGKASIPVEKGLSLKPIGEKERRRTRGTAAAPPSSSRSRAVGVSAPSRKEPPPGRSTRSVTTRNQGGADPSHHLRTRNQPRKIQDTPDEAREASADDANHPTGSNDDRDNSGDSGVHSTEAEPSPIATPRKRRRTAVRAPSVQAPPSRQEADVAQPTPGSPHSGSTDSQVDPHSQSGSDEDGDSSQSSDNESDSSADSPWFGKASEEDGQKKSWKAVIRHGRRSTRLNESYRTTELDSIRKPIWSMIALYNNLVERSEAGEGPSDNEVARCGRLLRKANEKHEKLLHKVFNLGKEGSTRADKKQGVALVQAFYKEIIPPMAKVVFLCYEIYHAHENLFSEAYGNLCDHLTTLSEWIQWVDSISGYLDQPSCVESDLRRALGELVQALNYGRLKKAQRPKPPEKQKGPPRGNPNPWTPDEEDALRQGLQKHPEKSTNRYKLIMGDFRRRLPKRGIIDLRKKAREMYEQYMSEIEEELTTEEGRKKWEWVTNIPGSR